MKVAWVDHDGLALLDLPWPAMNCIMPHLGPAEKLSFFRYAHIYQRCHRVPPLLKTCCHDLPARTAHPARQHVLSHVHTVYVKLLPSSRACSIARLLEVSHCHCTSDAALLPILKAWRCCAGASRSAVLYKAGHHKHIGGCHCEAGRACPAHPAEPNHLLG